MNSDQHQELPPPLQQPPQPAPPSSIGTVMTSQHVPPTPDQAMMTTSLPQHPPSSTHTSSPGDESQPLLDEAMATIALHDVPPPTSSSHSQHSYTSYTSVNVPKALTVQHSLPSSCQTLTTFPTQLPPTTTHATISGSQRSDIVPAASTVQHSQFPPPGEAMTTISTQLPPAGQAMTTISTQLPPAGQAMTTISTQMSPLDQTMTKTSTPIGQTTTTIFTQLPPAGQSIMTVSGQLPPTTFQPVESQHRHASPSGASAVQQPGQISTAASTQLPPTTSQPMVPQRYVNPETSAVECCQTPGQIMPTISSHLASASQHSFSQLSYASHRASSDPHTSGQITTAISSHLPQDFSQVTTMSSPYHSSMSSVSQYSPTQQRSYSSLSRDHQARPPSGQGAATLSHQHPLSVLHHHSPQLQRSYNGSGVSVVQPSHSSPSSHSSYYSPPHQRSHGVGDMTSQHGHPPPSSQYPPSHQHGFSSPEALTVQHIHSTHPSFLSHPVTSLPQAFATTHQHSASSYAPTGASTVMSQHHTGHITPNPYISPHHIHAGSGSGRGGSNLPPPTTSHTMVQNPHVSSLQGVQGSFGVHGGSMVSSYASTGSSSYPPHHMPGYPQTGYVGPASSTGSYYILCRMTSHIVSGFDSDHFIYGRGKLLWILVNTM